MSPQQIEGLMAIIVNDHELTNILKGGEKNVERGIQNAVSKSVQPRSKTEKVMVGGVDK